MIKDYSKMDDSEILFYELNNAIVNIYKLVIEEEGYDLGNTNNDINYINYLPDNPLDFSDIQLEGDDSQTGPNGGGTFGTSPFIDYNGPADGSIGSKVFPQGKGKALDPKGIYWPFYIFGFGASPKTKPDKAKSKRSAIDCCKLAVETVMDYLNKGCKTIGDVICMYHAGMPTYDKFLQYYHSRAGINDIADGRFVSSQEMIQRQNYYQQHLVDYTHMSNRTPLTKSYKVLFPLITFISRQEQGVNCEEVCRIALKEMNIT